MASEAQILPLQGRDGWPDDAARVVDQLLRVTAELRERAEQLQTALDSRVIIEQAKGVLAERLAIAPEQAFELLRAGARSHQLKLHDLAREVVDSAETPAALARELERKGLA